MDFETGHLYHIYNQGNNHQHIFLNEDNYLFFLSKIREYILPYADILAWCLMPNHFHLMVYVHSISIELSDSSDTMTPSHRITKNVTQSHHINKNPINKTRIFQDSIAIMLRSYTRAINKQEKTTGSLFRAHTKSECLTTTNGITSSFIQTAYGTEIYISIPEKEYPQVCFNYIHQNPVKAGLVANAEDWKFSSYADYCGKRKGRLVNKQRCSEFISTDTMTPSHRISM